MLDCVLTTLNPPPQGAELKVGFECHLQNMKIALPTDLFHSANEDYWALHLVGTANFSLNIENERMDVQVQPHFLLFCGGFSYK